MPKPRRPVLDLGQASKFKGFHGAPIKRAESHLEVGFLRVWKMAHPEAPEPEREYRFHPKRKWRFDFAFVDARVCVELEGGIYSKGRHGRAKGMTADAEKYNAATVDGWRVLRYTTDDLSKRPMQVVEEVWGLVNQGKAG